MQQKTKTTLENLDFSLKKLSKFAFDIDDESRIILGLIAKNGPSTETKITSLGIRRIYLSREKIRRRLLSADLSSGFTTIKKGKKIGNLKGKREKFFSLTFKGILASLYETKLSDNYWIKNYITNIEKITNKTISDLLLENMYHCIVLHFLLNVKTRGSLTDYNSSQKDVDSNYYSKGYLHHLVFSQNDIQGIPSGFQKLFASSAIEFYIQCTTISNLLYDLKLPSKFLLKNNDHEFFKESDRAEMEKSHFMILFFEDWMYTIFDVIGKTFEKVFKEDPDHDDIEESFNISKILEDSPTIEALSKQRYLKLNPQGKFDRAHTLLIPKPISSDRFFKNSIDD